jgi:hypothetical protein
MKNQKLLFAKSGVNFVRKIEWSAISPRVDRTVHSEPHMLAFGKGIRTHLMRHFSEH